MITDGGGNSSSINELKTNPHLDHSIISSKRTYQERTYEAQPEPTVGRASAQPLLSGAGKGTVGATSTYYFSTSQQEQFIGVKPQELERERGDTSEVEDDNTSQTHSESDSWSSSSSPSSGSSDNNNNNNNSNMNWFKSKKQIEEEQRLAREEARRRTAEAEIRQLLEVGTQREALENMYSPEDVSRVMAQVDKERAILAMVEAEAEVQAQQKAAEQTALHNEIRQLYQAGTQVEVLEQMYKAKDVADVVAQIEKEEEEAAEQEEAAAAEPEQDESESEHMTEEERDEMEKEIKQMLKANTNLSVLEAMYKPKYIQAVREKLKEEKRQEQMIEIQKNLDSIEPQSKLVLELKGHKLPRKAEPAYQVLTRSDDSDEWKMIYRSSHLESSLKTGWKPAKINLRDLWDNAGEGGNVATTPLCIKMLDWDKGGKHKSLGQVETTLQEIMQRAMARSKGDSDGGGGMSSKDDDELALACYDRSKKRGHILVLAASIVTPQETPEERAAKAAIVKTLQSLDEHSKLHITLQGVKLANVEGIMGCSDPFYQIESWSANSYNDDGDDGEWKLIYTSEHLNDNLNPEWQPAKISCLQLLGDALDPSTAIRISMFDWESNGKHQSMGFFTTSLQALLWRAESNRASRNMDEEDRLFVCCDETNKEYGSMLVVESSIRTMSQEEKTTRANIAEELSDLKEHSRLKIALKGIDLAEHCSEPFFEIASLRESEECDDAKWTKVYTSEHVREGNPEWKRAKLSLDELIDGDINRLIRVSLYDWKQDGGHEARGGFETTLDQLLLRSETSSAARAMRDELRFSCSDQDHLYGSLVVVDATVVGETQQEKEAREAIDESLQNIDERSRLNITFRGKHFAEHGCSEPFFEVYAQGEGDNGWHKVFKSERHNDNLNPVWKKAQIRTANLLANNNVKSPIRVAMFDWKKDGNHLPMGSFETTIRELLWRSKANVAAKSLGEDRGFVCSGKDQIKKFGSLVVVQSSIITETAEEKASRVALLSTLRSLTDMDENSYLLLSLRGSNLINMDGVFGASDPYYEISAKIDDEWKLVYRSEHLDNNMNPEWSTAKIPINTVAGESFHGAVRISMVDWEEKGPHKPMGYCDTTFIDLLWYAETNSAAVSVGDDRSFTCQDNDGKEYGSIIVSDAQMVTETLEEQQERAAMKKALQSLGRESTLLFSLRGENMANVEGWFSGASDPFFEIQAKLQNGRRSEWQTIYRSEHVENNLNPQWEPAMIPAEALLMGDIERDLRFCLFDWEESGKHRSMGSFETCVKDLLWRAEANKVSTMTKEERAFRAVSDDRKDFGAIYVVDASVETVETIAQMLKKESSGEGISSSNDIADAMTSLTESSVLLVKLKGINLANVEGFFGCSDPFYRISALDDGGNIVSHTVYTSEHLENSLNPEWGEATIPLLSLLNWNLNKAFRIAVFDWEENEKHRPMGYCDTTLMELLQHARAYSSKDSGSIKDSFFTLKDDGGKEYGTIVAIDAAVKSPGEEPEPMVKGKGTAALPEKEHDSDGAYSDDDVSEGGGDLSDQGSYNSDGEDDLSGSDETSGGGDDHGDYSDREGNGDEDDNGRSDDEGQEEELDIIPSLQNLEAGAELHITFMGTSLANVEGWFGKSDPFFEISDETGEILYTSEHIESNLDPIWKPAIILVEDVTEGDIRNIDRPLCVSLFDWEESGEHRPMGSFETSAQEMLDRVETSHPNYEEVIYEVRDEDDKALGRMLVVAALVVTPTEIGDRDNVPTLRFALEGMKMKNVEGWLGCSDPFFRVQTSNTDQGWKNVYQSEHIENSLAPKWRLAEILLDPLCGGDLNKPIRISVFDWDPSGSFTPMGFFETSVNGLLDIGLQDTENKFEVSDDRGDIFGDILIREIHLDGMDDASERSGNDVLDRGMDIQEDVSLASSAQVSDSDLDDLSHSQRSDVDADKSDHISEGSHSRSQHSVDTGDMPDSISDGSHSRSYRSDSRSVNGSYRSDEEGTAGNGSDSGETEGRFSDGELDMDKNGSVEPDHSEKQDGSARHSDLGNNDKSFSQSEPSSHRGDLEEADIDDPERMRDFAEIKQLYEVGTQVEVLEQMFDPADVAKVVAQVSAGNDSIQDADERDLEKKAAELDSEHDLDPAGDVEEDQRSHGSITPSEGSDGDVRPDKVDEPDDASQEAGESSSLAEAATGRGSSSRYANSEGALNDKMTPQAMEALTSAVPSASGDTVKALEERIFSLEKSLDEYRKRNSELETNCSKYEENNSALQSTCDELAEKNSSLESTCDVLRKSMNESEKKNAALQVACDQLKESLSESHKQSHELQETCDDLTQQNEVLQEKNEMLLKKSASLQDSCDDFQEKTNKLQTSLDELEQTNAELDEALKTAIAEKTDALNKLTEVETTAEIKEKRFIKSLETMTAKKEALEAELAQNKDNGSASAAETDKLTAENKQLTDRVAELEASIKDNEGRLATANSMVKNMDELRKEISSLTNQNQSLQAKISELDPTYVPEPLAAKTSKRRDSEKRTRSPRRTESKDGDHSPRRADNKDGDRSPRRTDTKDGERSPRRTDTKDGDRAPRRTHTKDGERSKTSMSSSRKREGERDKDRERRHRDHGDRPKRSESGDKDKDNDRMRDKSDKGERSSDKDKERSSGDKDRRDRERSSRDKDKDRERRRRDDKDRDRDKDRDKDKDRDRDRKDRDRDRDRDRDKDRKPRDRRRSEMPKSDSRGTSSTLKRSTTSAG